jgi:hypothetical protein
MAAAAAAMVSPAAPAAVESTTPAAARTPAGKMPVAVAWNAMIVPPAATEGTKHHRRAADVRARISRPA